jgi:endonuclease YncB( thermonuclease family)
MQRLARLSFLLVLLGACAPAFAASSLPFVEDDYGRALAEARARKLPLFIESWAPW